MDKKSETKKWIVSLILVLIFSFFGGYYVSYRINEKEKSKLEIIQEIMENEWYYGIDDEDLKETLETKMILGMLDTNKDPYTRYLTSLGSLADSYTGIGITVSIYGEYFIVEEVSSKNAVIDGIKVGDIIMAINDTPVANKTLEELNHLVLEKDSIVLKVKRNGEEVTINTSVTTYEPITVFTKEYGSVAYVRISEFNLDTASHLEEYFSSLPSNVKDLVLDLRGNPGGYISAVKEVLDLFVESNKIVMTTVDKNGNSSVIKTQDDNLYLFEEIVVLIDENSASGAEALAAALDYHLDNKVTLYGNTTYGKGSAQKTINFSDGTYFHYTYALWYTPEGITINHKGVEPEVKTVNDGISSIAIPGVELELYDYGEDVLNVQKLLNKLGLYSGPLHSFLDEETSEAIKTFQAENELEVTGKVDNSTLRYIAKLIYDDKVDYLDTELQTVLGSMNQ